MDSHKHTLCYQIISVTSCCPWQAGMSAHCMLTHQVKITAVCMMQGSMPTSSDAGGGFWNNSSRPQVTQCKQSIQQDVCVYGATTITIKLSRRLEFSSPPRFPYTQLSALAHQFIIFFPSNRRRNVNVFNLILTRTPLPIISQQTLRRSKARGRSKRNSSESTYQGSHKYGFFSVHQIISKRN